MCRRAAVPHRDLHARRKPGATSGGSFAGSAAVKNGTWAASRSAAAPNRSPGRSGCEQDVWKRTDRSSVPSGAKTDRDDSVGKPGAQTFVEVSCGGVVRVVEGFPVAREEIPESLRESLADVNQLDPPGRCQFESDFKQRLLLLRAYSLRPRFVNKPSGYPSTSRKTNP